MPADARYKNGNFRRKMRQRFKAMNAPCHICNGRLGEIDYDAPVDIQHPLSFVIDEILPISRYGEWGYPSREACARDINNLSAAHYICNLRKSNRTMKEMKAKNRAFVRDGNW